MWLVRIGLIIGFAGSLFLSIGILGAARVKRIEISTEKIIKTIIVSKKLFNSIFADDPAYLMRFTFIIVFISSLILSILTFDLFKDNIYLEYYYSFKEWHWGIHFWIHLLLYMISLMYIIIFPGVYNQIKSRKLFVKLHKKIISIVFLFISVFIILSVIPIILVWIIFLWIIIYSISFLVWLLSFPIQFGFKVQNKFEINGAYEIAGLLFLALAFILQFISTFE